MAEKPTQGELLPNGKTATVAPGRTVAGDLRNPAKTYGPGETVELGAEDIARFTELGFLVTDKGTTRPLDEGPTVSIEGEPTVTVTE